MPPGDLQENGLAAPSWTSLHGHLVVRCAIVNHRTTKADVDRFVATLFDRLDDWDRATSPRRSELTEVDEAGVAVVADDDVVAAAIPQHGGRNFAGSLAYNSFPFLFY